MPWTDLSGAFAYGAILTSAQMQQLRDNIIAVMAKDAGAPVLADNYIVNQMLSNGTVTATKMDSALKTATVVFQTDDKYELWFTNGVLVGFRQSPVIIP